MRKILLWALVVVGGGFVATGVDKLAGYQPAGTLADVIHTMTWFLYGAGLGIVSFYRR